MTCTDKQSVHSTPQKSFHEKYHVFSLNYHRCILNGGKSRGGTGMILSDEEEEELLAIIGNE